MVSARRETSVPSLLVTPPKIKVMVEARVLPPRSSPKEKVKGEEKERKVIKVVERIADAKTRVTEEVELSPRVILWEIAILAELHRLVNQTGEPVEPSSRENARRVRIVTIIIPLHADSIPKGSVIWERVVISHITMEKGLRQVTKGR